MPHLATKTPSAPQPSLAMSFTPSKPGNGLCAFADNASVTVVNPASDALTAAAVLEVPLERLPLGRRNFDRCNLTLAMELTCIIHLKKK